MCIYIYRICGLWLRHLLFTQPSLHNRTPGQLRKRYPIRHEKLLQAVHHLRRVFMTWFGDIIRGLTIKKEVLVKSYGMLLNLYYELQTTMARTQNNYENFPRNWKIEWDTISFKFMFLDVLSVFAEFCGRANTNCEILLSSFWAHSLWLCGQANCEFNAASAWCMWICAREPGPAPQESTLPLTKASLAAFLVKLFCRVRK